MTDPKTASNEYHPFIVLKYFEPTGSYKQTLQPLSDPDNYETIADSLGVVAERRFMTPEEAIEVSSRQHIASVEADRKIFDVPTPPKEIGPESATVNADQARAFHNIPQAVAAGYRGKGYNCAVLDTGITADALTKLGSRIVAKESFVEGQEHIDTSPAGHSHGTWCIGCISDIAPDAGLIVIRVLGADGGYTSWVISGVNRAVELGANVLSMSLGGGQSPALDAAVNAARQKGVLVACAAGNEQKGRTDYPADANSPGEATGAQCVAAVDSDSQIGYFSNWGNSVDIAAIGVYIQNDWQPGAWSGTSMATPHIAGVDLIGLSTGLGPDAVEKALYASARDTALEAFKEGHGIADAQAMIGQLVASKPKPPDTPVNPTPPAYFPDRPRINYLMKNKWISQPCVLIDISKKELGEFTPKS